MNQYLRPDNHQISASRTPPSPVVVLAWIGAICLLFAASWIIRWLLSPDFATTYPSTKALAETPDSVKTLIFLGEMGSLVTAVFFFYLWFIRAKLKTGKFSFMGLLCVASMTTYAINPAENYYSYGIAYSSFLHNWGSWANMIPGFSYPNQNKFPEAPLMWGASFIWFNLVFALLFYWMWKQLDSRFPGLGFTAKMATLLVAMFTTDVIFESLVLRVQLYAYIGAIQKWSLFGGHYYQFPLFVGVITAVFWLVVTSLIYSRDDKGHSWAERGVDKLKISDSSKTFVRFLALTGAMWVITITTYYIPIQWYYTHGDAFPTDTPDHLLNTHVLCGEHLGYACPGKGVPIPRRDQE
jgi:Spirocyclase AveC-like